MSKEGSLSCHACYDTTPRFLCRHPKDSLHLVDMVSGHVVQRPFRTLYEATHMILYEIVSFVQNGLCTK